MKLPAVATWFVWLIPGRPCTFYFETEECHRVREEAGETVPCSSLTCTTIS